MGNDDKDNKNIISINLSFDLILDCQISKTAMIIERVKAYRRELVSQLEPKALASVLSKSKSFSENIRNTVNDANSCYERVERILLLVENGDNDIVEEFITALNDFGYCEIVKLINPPDVHEKAGKSFLNILLFVLKVNTWSVLKEYKKTNVIIIFYRKYQKYDNIKLQKYIGRNADDFSDRNVIKVHWTC